MTEGGGLAGVFRANREKLLRFFTLRLGGAQDAEDCLQDLWLKLATLGSGPVADPAPYLFRMADNLAIDRLRSNQRRVHRDDAWQAARQTYPPEADDQPSIERELIGRERLARMEQALNRLPERTSTIFRRFRIDGVPQKQIARELGITVSGIEKHLQKASRAVLDALDALDEEMEVPQRPEGKESLIGKR
jgi:RNA polymerase sigma-70 factor (ECF subfamily)